MAVPLDAIRAIHNAFRKDMAAINAAAYNAAAGGDGLKLVIGRSPFFNDILVWHAIAEDRLVFPAVDKVAPLIAEPYERDHCGLDSLYESLDKAVNNGDLLETARVAAAFHFHLFIHLEKEEAHLYRVFNERIPLPEQAGIIGQMAQQIPQDRFPEVVAWLFPLVDIQDRENMVRIWQKALPEAAFAGVVQLIRKAIGDGWKELVARIPELG